ncbi:hypothetical protein [Sinorhizobium medicae]|uniref:Uncharacterized protein n=1 Tax=Sinorhizobium medicae TaxID=110321 RepID=A0A508X6D9_9HYPH|nr:hypothetical protein [Sinorhizobium medicae]MDX0422385.1 hypothetical protein [Sinorhizobium medicae]MDX0519950.1 hypothetical protein [Sinorhizobium medicae]MDX0544748.1 hypothetical protein [Sinorhizobium medicae]MDX0631591.1 hypothetical protein [Sinorhizobium medicae]MDX0711184.1 hypothetical protein [Sinorhizobium medicae]
MSKQTVEVAGEAVGALIPDNGRLRFLAVKFSVWSLDGRVFATPDEARKAVAAVHGLEKRAPVFSTGMLAMNGQEIALAPDAR